MKKQTAISANSNLWNQYRDIQFPFGALIKCQNYFTTN